MIEFVNVKKTLGGKMVLDGLNLRIEKGETFVIVGPSGTGKSVTLNHIIGLLKADSGSVIIDGQDICCARGSEMESLRMKMGMLFQSGALLNWMSIYDNVALPLRERTKLSENEIHAKVCTILDFLEMGDAALKMPGEVSGGMVKRAGLARAIICDPAIMLYDEPTSGLDPLMSRKIDSLIKSLKKKFSMTSVVVTHDLVSAFSIGDKIAMLYDGVVHEQGTIDEFMKSQKPLVREFISAQYGNGSDRKAKI